MDLILLLVIGLLTRFLFIVGGASERSDQSSHLWMIKRREEIGDLREATVKNSVLDGIRGYPSFPHLVISFLPEKYWKVVGLILNTTYDMLSLILVYVFVNYGFPIDITMTVPGFTIGGMTGLIVITLPGYHSRSSRLIAIGGRTLSLFIFLIYAIVLYHYFLSQSLFVLSLSIPIVIWMIVSSQFGMQVTFFTACLLSGFYDDPSPFVFFVGSVVIGWFIPKLGIKNLLKRKFDHYLWYVRNQESGTTATNRNRPSDIIKLPYYLFARTRKFLKLIFKKLTPFIAAYYYPPLVLLLIIFPYTEYRAVLQSGPELKFGLLVTCVTLIAFAFTSIRYFLFLGEAERYLGYSAPFFSVLFLYLVDKSSYFTELVTLAVLLNFLGILVNLSLLHSNKISGFLLHPKDELSGNPLKTLTKTIRDNLSNEPADEFQELLESLRNTQHRNILSIPTKWNFKLSYYLWDEPFNYYFDNITDPDNLNGLQYMDDEHEVLHYVKPDFDYFNRTYGIDTVVVTRSGLETATNHGIDYDFSTLNLRFENDKYLVYEIPEHSNNA